MPIAPNRRGNAASMIIHVIETTSVPTVAYAGLIWLNQFQKNIMPTKMMP